MVLQGARRLLPILIGAVLTALPGCADPAGEAVSEEKHAVTSHQFFENSTRRDADSAEASRVARVANVGCAAFFVENTAKKVYVATARHCFDFAMDVWCENSGVIVDNAEHRGTCTRVVAADDHHDIAIFESNIAHASSGASTLRLASYIPKVGAKLVMTGYPVDEDPLQPRRGRLTTTDNCWTLGGAVDSPFMGKDDEATIDRSARHNCSTFGGNSGGPMYVEGTRDAIGVPFMYQDDYTRRSATNVETASYLALMSDFVSVHSDELSAAGVVVAEGDGAADDGSDGKDESEASSSKSKRPVAHGQAGGAACAMATMPSAGSAGWPAGLVVALAVVARRRARARRQRARSALNRG